MAKKGMPAPRPALQRASDSGIHPALVVPTRGDTAEPAKADPTESDTVKKSDSAKKTDAVKKKSSKKRKGGKGKRKAAERKTDPKPGGRTSGKQTAQRERGRSFLGAGRTTSDSIVVSKSASKRVQLTVSMPKSLRKEIRRRAAESGVSVDEFVSGAMTARLRETRRW